MGEARHHPVRPGLGLVEQRTLERRDPLDRRVDLVAHPEPEIGRHLVISAARGVQPARRRADQRLEPRLHVHVDVLELGAELEPAALDL